MNGDIVKIYLFKTHCKGDSRRSKTANIILPGLMIKRRRTPLRLQAKWYSHSFNCIMLVQTTHLTPVENYRPIVKFGKVHQVGCK